LTSQILAPEETLGLQLFERSRAGTLLAPNGRELLANARRLLEESQGLLDRAESLARGPSGTYRLGVTPTLGPYLLPKILPTIHRRYARLKLYIREDAPRDLEAGLLAGDHDLILTPLPIEDPRLAVTPLFHEPVQLVMSSAHRLARKRRIEREDLSGEAVLTIQEHHHFHEQIQRLCDRLGARVLRDYEGTSLDTLRHMVVLEMGVAFLPALYVLSEIHRPRELRVRHVHQEAIERTHAIAWRATSPSRQLFRAITREIQVVLERELGRVVRMAFDGVSGSRRPRPEERR